MKRTDPLFIEAIFNLFVELYGDRTKTTIKWISRTHLSILKSPILIKGRRFMLIMKIQRVYHRHGTLSFVLENEHRLAFFDELNSQIPIPDRKVIEWRFAYLDKKSRNKKTVDVLKNLIYCSKVRYADRIKDYQGKINVGLAAIVTPIKSPSLTVVWKQTKEGVTQTA